MKKSPRPTEISALDGASPHHVSPPARWSVIAFAALCLGFHTFGQNGWVPILDNANLAFHEAGHPLLGLLNSRLMVYGGTIFQLAFPVAVAMHFRKQGHVVGETIGQVWLGESLLNVARYMGDARAQVLPLVGGGEHDWTEILGRWGLLHLDTRLASSLRFCASLFIIAVCVRLLLRRH